MGIASNIPHKTHSFSPYFTVRIIPGASVHLLNYGWIWKMRDKLLLDLLVLDFEKSN